MQAGAKTAVVTGGGTGIGALVARRLAAGGVRVWVAGRRLELLQDVAGSIRAAGGEAKAIRCDVTSADEVAALAREVGHADIVVNNAGIAKSAPIAKMDDAHWHDAIAVNLTGTFLVTRAFIGGMQDRGWGRVVNVASVAGKIGFKYTAAYSAAKHGVLGLTRSVAIEVAHKGVTVNAVCPGWVETDMSENAIANIAAKTKLSREAALKTLADQSPQKRLMTAEEVASLVEYLCSDDAANITAQAINLDGGMLQS